MRKALYWIPSIIFLLVFGLILGIFHPLQVIARSLGYTPHKKVVDAMIFCLNYALILVGSKPKIRHEHDHLSSQKPMIIISNHQSMFDIPAIGVVLRRHHPKFIAKVQLSKGIPSVSYNIRRGGSIIIDRKNPQDAIEKINVFTNYLKKSNRAGCIFPEGTRSRDGSMRPFKKSGLLALLEQMPTATVVPVAMNNYWKIARYNYLPIPFAMKLSCTSLQPIPRSHSNEQIIELAEKQIKQFLESANKD